MSDWSIERARACYNIAHWSGGYFDIGPGGRVLAYPSRHAHARGVDLYELALELREQGLNWPVLVRFPAILRDRVRKLNACFARAMAGQAYAGRYTPVYPVKVNQQRTVVAHLLDQPESTVGLEAGSKPELMVVLGLSRPGGVIICNGYKDREYIRLALIGQRLGHDLVIVLEKQSELDWVLAESAALGIEPQLGLRVRLASLGKGKWQNTGGEKSKFGFSAGQVLQVVERLRQAGRLDCLKLLHCHLGSQLANIRDIQKGLQEVARYYAELRALGAPIARVDVGGGLGVDYEGSRSRSFCSMNYTMQEYANDVVSALAAVCQQENLPHPGVITESGRAMTAHHAVLICNVIGVEKNLSMVGATRDVPPHPVLQALERTLRDLSGRSVLEAYHDAVYWLAEAQGLFSHGVLDLRQRARAEQLYYRICSGVRPLLRASSRAHREVLDELDEKLAQKYFCNLSIFQSLPDIWGIEQIFPIVPLQRLDEAPTVRATLQDLTCDSDGVIERFVDGESVESTLRVHELAPGETYLLGVFLTGAYQEILGDMHNLFGDTHAIDVELLPEGGYRLGEAELGDTVDEVLRYVHYSPAELVSAYRRKLEAAGLGQDDAAACLRELEAGLCGYTYLED